MLRKACAGRSSEVVSMRIRARSRRKEQGNWNKAGECLAYIVWYGIRKPCRQEMSMLMARKLPKPSLQHAPVRACNAERSNATPRRS